ncbi:MAG TPA: hypothetical protein VKS43_01595 [Burkholderiales bacterium]|nr:hypothetical protein [Burkholderiales bacterium]
MSIRISILAASALAMGCTTLPAYQLDGRSNLINGDGHVVGYRLTTHDAHGAEAVAQTVLYLPRNNEQGELVGYEERIAGGSILRDFNGKVVGERWVDMRSRGSNPRNKGLAVVFLQ